jgi:hypothetical protein
MHYKMNDNNHFIGSFLKIASLRKETTRLTRYTWPNMPIQIVELFDVAMQLKYKRNERI